MDYIEVKTVGGSPLAIKKDFILFFRDFSPIPDDIVKENPFLKGFSRCSFIQLTDPRVFFFCSDRYEDIINQLK